VNDLPKIGYEEAMTVSAEGHKHARFVRDEFKKWAESKEGRSEDDDNLYGKLTPEDHLDWR
jgi:hypothetical protein